MKFRFTLDLRHWMIGFTFDWANYTTLFSLGPLNLWMYNERRYKRDYERQILKNAEMMHND